MEKERKTVLLALAWHLEKLTQGIADYARAHNWHLLIHRGGELREILRRWRGNGIISSFWNAYTDSATEEVLAARSWDATRMVSLVPIRNPRIPCRVVREDDYAIGTLAAEYFLGTGHRNYAVYSDSVRMTGFRDRLRRSGFACCDLSPYRAAEREEAELLGWLRELPKPCAVFCENDWDAAELLNTAFWGKIAVPDELAILGVGNDELVCMAASVSLSSVDSRLYELGQLAAAELDKLIDGTEAPEGALFLKPEPLVVERRSTDFYAVENPELIRMIEYFRNHACEPFSVAEAARRFHTSESALYKLFVRNLKISPKQFVLEQRLRNACSYLKMERAWPMEEVARRAGFPTACAMFSIFQKRFGTSPGNWRKNSQSTINL
ncbi:MAG: hypothetical protein DBX90_01480 [Lentisphaerae bacterium]|uniref:substrate-binding domain-containing protein n=1 Tax=uncultured Victivallis sp. TaxID=354118 RepID=UPI000D7AFEF8|nr:substrate-binding domain-containing protein [uncultured Victivallis sp.]PWM88134.1 MAG: hypothetical protein DBX90_01480 [Lentisphaerota bacterium]